MAVDRDLAVSVVSAWGRTHENALEGWDALAATGVRGLRLMNETGSFRRMVLTELHPLALLTLRENTAPWAERGALAIEHDARTSLAGARFDFVDVDPFGTPVPFVDAALENLRPGGLLGLAATDMPVLAGVERGAAERRYGGRPVRGRLGPEGGLRLLLAYLSNRLKASHRRLRPLVAYVHDHHVRAYLEIREGAAELEAVSVIQPNSWDGPKLGGAGPFGPMWLGKIFDLDFVREMRVPWSAHDPDGTALFLERFREEATADVPFYYEPNELARSLRLREPPSLDEIIGSLKAQGWRAGRTHARHSGFRTEAPRAEVERLTEGLGQRR